jgi:hypothetical protein
MKPLTTTPKKKLTVNDKLFLKYVFKGDGIYRPTERGARRYVNTVFNKFYLSNYECVDITEKGNDAPKGGKLGDFVHAVFLPDFYIKYGHHIEEIERDKREAEQNDLKAIERRKEQLKALEYVFTTDLDFKAKIKERINKSSSKNWRSFVKLKVCQRIANERFNLFELTATDIRQLAFKN